MQFDLVIIGSGPGGYVCAIRAAQLGLKVAVVEKDTTFGGTCLNVGCIPSKALLESSELYHQAQHDFGVHGVVVKGVELDLSVMMSRKAKIVKDLTQGIAFLFKKNKIDSFKGKGRIAAPGKVVVELTAGGTQEIATKNIVCATGSVPLELPFLKFDEQKIVSSTGALSISTVPKTLVVVGGGVIGLELGSVWSRLGAKVTIVEFADRIGGGMDTQIVGVLQKSMAKAGVEFLLSTKVVDSRKVKGKSVVPPVDTLVELEVEGVKDGKKSQLQADVVLVSTGRKPFADGLGLEELGIARDKLGRVIVNANYQTNVPGIYAIGDLIPGPMLAHKAEEEGVAVAEGLVTGHGHVNYATVPGIIYTHPEVASVGMTEEDAAKAGIPVAVGTFPYSPNGRARAIGSTDGMVKIITDSRSDRIIGGHIVGIRAGELLAEVVIAMEFGGSAEDLARSFHAHPTLNEVVREAALAVSKRARQM